MVEGKAHRPFVYRTLLPTTVRIASSLVPDQYRQACADLVEQHYLTRRIFGEFRWESGAAFEYVLASLLMLLCFMGFAHCVVRLTERACAVPDASCARFLLATGALVGLPPFFRYTSFPYDPPQLFLFTLALYFLAAHRSRAFLIAFVLCCLNKETAVLLIPLYGLTFRNRSAPRRRYWSTMLALIVVYVSIKLALTWIFHATPGSFVEFHLRHNAEWFTRGWTFTDAAVLLSLAALLVFRWSEKPAFLRVSFICVFPPMAALALFLGYVDEWRGYYEAYPIAFGLVVDSLLRLRDVLCRDLGIGQPEHSADDQWPLERGQ